MELKTHYTAQELVYLRLPGLPTAKKNVIAQAVREQWQSQPRSGRGGGLEYALTSLPLETQLHLNKKHHADRLPAIREAAPAPAIVTAPATPELTTLTKHQVAVMDARVWFMRLIESRPQGCSVKRAMADIAADVAAGKQPCATMAAAANDRKGKDRKLTASTIMKWWSDKWLPSGKNPSALAPTRHIFAAGSHFPPAAFTCSRRSFSTYSTATRTRSPSLRRGEGCQGFSSITSSTVFNRTPRSSSYRYRTYRSELPKRSVSSFVPFCPGFRLSRDFMTASIELA